MLKAAADQAGLPSDEPQVLLVAVALGLGEGEQARVDPGQPRSTTLEPSDVELCTEFCQLALEGLFQSVESRLVQGHTGPAEAGRCVA
jgi:hypothetical protein